MAIKGLAPQEITSFVGKNTQENLAAGSPESLLSAKNMIVNADNKPRRAPGYTLVANVNAGPVYSQYSFERNVDGAQFVFVHSGSEIWAMQPDGTGKVRLSTGESSTPHMFVQNSFAAYCSNGTTAWRFVDVGGTLTKFQWGITKPSATPTESISGGTLTLTYGRRYVYCYVSKYTDSLGIQRVSVSAPSPFSAHTGPTNAAVVNVGGMTASTDPQVNYKWIFATVDSPIDTSSTFMFAAEIPNSQVSWGDSLVDSALDTTRLAPFDNNPAPPSEILDTFQNRVVAVAGTQARLSGFDEITLGIPEESWPLSLFFNVPAGSRKATAAATINAGAVQLISTDTSWFAYQGYNAQTFTEKDAVASPGACGSRAHCLTPFGLAYMSRAKRVWLWNGNGAPTELSASIAMPLAGTYGMDDLSITDMRRVELRWYSYGVRHFIAAFCRTNDAPDANLNLIQLWNIAVQGGVNNGMVLSQTLQGGMVKGTYQTDKIPTVSMTSSALVNVNSVPYIFCGDAGGNVYRFPDGFLDNGNSYQSSLSTVWLKGVEGKTRFYWADFFIEPSDATINVPGVPNSFTVAAVASDAPNYKAVTGYPLNLQLIPAPEGQNVFSFRANLQAPGTNVGRYVRLFLVLPSSASDEVLDKIIVWGAPLYQGAP